MPYHVLISVQYSIVILACISHLCINQVFVVLPFLPSYSQGYCELHCFDVRSHWMVIFSKCWLMIAELETVGRLMG